MMKKLLALLFIATLVLTFAACGNGDNGADENGTAAGATNSVIEDFLVENSADISAMAEAMTGDMGTDGRVEIVAGTGNELIYKFIYGSDFDFEGMEDMLGESLLAMGSFFEMMAESFRDELELEYMRITVRYYDGAGNIIVAESFDSNR